MSLHFKALFKIHCGGGVIEAKPQELKGILIEALALKLAQEVRYPTKDSCSSLIPRKDIHSMLQSITVEEMTQEEFQKWKGTKL